MDKSLLPWYYVDNIAPDIVDETHVSETPSITYLGFWQQKGAISDNPLEVSQFQIRKVTVNAGITIREFAGGSEVFDKKWSERENYNYSFLK